MGGAFSTLKASVSSLAFFPALPASRVDSQIVISAWVDGRD